MKNLLPLSKLFSLGVYFYEEGSPNGNDSVAFLDCVQLYLKLEKKLWFLLIKNEQLLVSYFTFISLQIGLYQSV